MDGLRPACISEGVPVEVDGLCPAAAVQGPPPVEWFVLNAEANVEVDLTALDALDQLRIELNRRGITFAMARVKQDLAMR
jgi:MFS superfamily sulfate permease-like transporter